QQVVHIPVGFGGPYLDGSQTIYNATGGTELIQEPLVVYDPNTATVKPAAATGWSISPDRRTWTFHIRKGLVWSDGTALTANDYAFMFRRQAEPTTGYDFPYFPQTVMALKNWTKINAGKLPPSALGVSSPDPSTLKIASAMPRPYLPSAMVYSWPEPQQMVHKYGNKWCTKLATMVFSGPYKPIQWVKNQHLLLVPNPAYRGVRHHFLQKIYFELGATNDLASYQAGTLDYVQLNAGQLAFAEHTVPEQIVHVSTFSVNYLTYNTYTRPFNDLRVRRAFNLAIDRLTLARDVLKNVARPVYTLLMPGFPGYDPTIKVPYDVATARRLLAQAGYPNGKGFPAITIYLRNQAGVVEIEKPAAEYIQAQLKQNLGISLGVKVIDLKVFFDAINKHTQPLFLVP